MQDHIEARIRTVISDPANDRQMIDSTLKLKRFIDKSVAGLFAAPVRTIHAKGDEDVEMEDKPKLSAEERNKQLELEDAVRSGFKAGLGSRQNAPAEWIGEFMPLQSSMLTQSAKHLDMTMRKGQVSSTEAEFNVLLDEIVALIGYTPDKDVFRAFYSTGLAKRLLLNKSASDDMERNMIIKLQKGGSWPQGVADWRRNGRRVHLWSRYDEGSPAVRDVSTPCQATLTMQPRQGVPICSRQEPKRVQRPVRLHSERSYRVGMAFVSP